MSHPSTHEAGSGPAPLKQRPRRPFELSSPPQSEPVTPTDDGPNLHTPSLAVPSGVDGSSTPARTRSILNLTSSTLFGIYQPTGYATEREEPSTPWGTGAETPADSRSPSLDISRANIPDAVLQNGKRGPKLRRKSVAPAQQLRRRPRRGFLGYFVPLLARNVALFAAGLFYGLLITNLHDQQKIAPVEVALNRSSWTYLIFWGLAGAALGQALPWVDRLWVLDEDDVEEQDNASKGKHSRRQGANLSGLEGWMDVIRSIGAFVGIAYAIRKLPWQSSSQLSLTLALANPAIWYLIDRSPPGFVFSVIVALGGTALLLGINPALVPSPPNQIAPPVGATGTFNGSAPPSVAAEGLVLGMFRQESVGVVTWIASVLFVSSVCFGNIGRRLAN